MMSFDRWSNILSTADGGCDLSSKRDFSTWITANPVPCSHQILFGKGDHFPAAYDISFKDYDFTKKKKATLLNASPHNISILVYTSYIGDVEEIIYDLINMQEEYGGWITVKDLYSHEYVDCYYTWIDRRWGWKELYFDDVKFIRDPSGWIIKMPEAKPINNEEEKPMRKTVKYNSIYDENKNKVRLSEDFVQKVTFKPACYDNTDIPFIDRVETYNDRVVKVTFIDGTFTKSVCSENDIFDLDVGITICLMKRWLGKDGNRLYNNLIRKVHKRMDQKERLAEREKKLRAEMREKERKMKAKREAKKEKARKEQIEIQKQAYIEALKAAGGIDGREDDLK